MLKVDPVVWVVRDTVGVVSCPTENSHEYDSRIMTRPHNALPKISNNKIINNYWMRFL